MAFARLETSARNHRKFRRLDPGAIGLWAMGLIYCQDQLSDGHVPRDEVPLLLPGTAPKRALAFAEALVEAQLWERAEGGDYQVHDYLDWNPSRDQVLQGRSDARDRMRALRSGARSAHVQPNTGSRSPARSEERSEHVRGTFAARSQQDVDVDSDKKVRSLERSSEQPRLGVNGLPELPADVYHHDCPEFRWRGGCVNRAYVAAHPEIRGYPTTRDGTPKSCPAHVGATA